MAVSDRVAIFYNGRLQQVDSPQGIYFAPVNQFTAEFMGACNLLEMRPLNWDPASKTARMQCADKEFAVLLDDAPRQGQALPMMLRPDWLREAGPDAAATNAFDGQVRDVMFLGATMVYHVAALGATLRVDVPALRGREAKKPGDPIRLCFAPASPVRVDN